MLYLSPLLIMVALQTVVITTHCHHAFALGSVCGWKGGVKFGYDFFFSQEACGIAPHMIMNFCFEEGKE